MFRAFLFWKQGNRIGAALARLWPLAVLVFSICVAIIQGIVGGFFAIAKSERTIWVGPVQERFMNALGHRRRIGPPGRDIHIVLPRLQKANGSMDEERSWLLPLRRIRVQQKGNGFQMNSMTVASAAATKSNVVPCCEIHWSIVCGNQDARTTGTT